mgnify:CR=1 FL=1
MSESAVCKTVDKEETATARDRPGCEEDGPHLRARRDSAQEGGGACGARRMRRKRRIHSTAGLETSVGRVGLPYGAL